MILASSDEVGYKSAALKRAALRSTRRAQVAIVVTFAVLCAGIFWVTQYLANVPRERAQNNLSYWRRVAHGADLTFKMLSASLSAEDFGRNQSVLPLAEIFIGGEKVDRLNESLPDSGRVFQKAVVKLTDEVGDSHKVLKAKVRYRGDSINHWAMPQKSWRIQLRKDRLFEGRDTFNLYLPRTSSQVADYIGYMMGRQMGLLTPKAYPVHFRLNRRFDGTRVFLEQVDQNFLANRGLDPWYIFVGDINTNQIYGGQARKRLFQSPESWSVVAPNVDRGSADSDMGEKRILHQLASVLNRDRSPYDFVDQISQVLDVDGTLRYMALLDIVGSLHVDDTHNQKWYLNPRSGVLTPIVWDTTPYYWGNKNPLSNGSNLLFRRMLQIPEFHARKNKIMWEAIHGPLNSENLQRFVREEAERLKADIVANAFKQTALSTKLNFLSTEGWAEGIEALQRLIRERNDRIVKEFSESSLTARWEGDSKLKKLIILPSGNAAIKGEAFNVSITGATAETKVRIDWEEVPVGQERTRTQSLEGAVNVEQGTVHFTLRDRWYPWATPRKMLKKASAPATYRYVVRIDGPGGLEGINALTGISDITGVTVTATVVASDNSASGPANGWMSLEDLGSQQAMILQGAVLLSEDLILSPHQDLVIKPGANIRMGPGVSIVLKGGALSCRGTADAPIVIESADPNRTWGVIALQGVNQRTRPKSSITYTTIRGGSYSYRNNAFYEASLSVHSGLLLLQNASFERSRVAVKDGELELRGAKFLSLDAQPVVSVNSKVKSEQVQVERIPLVHPVGMVFAQGSGTPPRDEREYRYAISSSPQQDRAAAASPDGDRVASVINNALKKSVQDSSLWQACSVSNAPYRVSENFESSVYRDIYIDSAERVNYKNNISYRLRNRFKSLRAHNQHLKQPSHPGFWPYRSEFQAKVGRENPETGLTVVREGRFEFRRQSKPFSAEFPPPPPPWPLADLLPHMMLGTFFGEPTSPGKLASEYLQSVLAKNHGPVVYSPQVVVVTERRRQHLEIKTPWGTGPNPDQSFIITLDSSKIFDAEEYLRVVDAGEHGSDVKLPVEKGQLLELEMEFERNVSEGVARALQVAIDSGNEAEARKMREVEQAFIHDQERVVDVIKEALTMRGITFEPVDKSKFAQASDLLAASRDKNVVSSSVSRESVF